MAKTVYDIETVELLDGTEVLLRPLAIGRLKKFMKVWGEITKMDTNDDDEVNEKVFDIYVRCAGIALQKELSEKFPEVETITKSGELNEDYYEYLEDVLDTQTAEKVLSVCGGLKLNDPKLQEAMQEAALKAAAGTR